MATSTHTIPQLGRLESVPIREVWASEPYSFDPWLIQPENLQFLAESLGLPGLELVQAQQPVGPFYADIVCKVIDTDHIVLIENQLAQADHRHLGQVLTYAPHVDARVCVWVAEKIRDEHRAAVDWLNRITAEGYAFFGVEVRAVRIGGSVPAPLFEVVAKPNDWAKISLSSQAVGSSSSQLTPSHAEYWPGLHAKLLKLGGPLRRVSTDLTSPTYWAPIAGSGRAYIWAFRSISRNPYVVAGLSLYNAGAAEVWSSMRQSSGQYEEAFGAELEWYLNKKGTAAHVQTARRPCSLEPADWEAQHEWLASMMQKFDSIFSQPVKQLIEDYDLGNLTVDPQHDSASE